VPKTPKSKVPKKVPKRVDTSHKGGMEEAQLEEMFGAMLVLPQA
jgi:hypothetical protein